MFTVKFVKYEAAAPSKAMVLATEAVSLREVAVVHVRYEPYHGPSDTPPRTVVQLGDAPGETTEWTVGTHHFCQYSVAYVMNASGRTVETIR